MIWFLICLTAAGAFGAGLVWAQARGLPEDVDDAPGRLNGSPEPLAALPPRPPRAVPCTGDAMEELFKLSSGDVVSHLSADHCIARVTRFESPDALVIRAHTDDQDRTCILVADIPFPWACVCKPARSHVLSSRLPDVVEHGGFRYRRLRRVEARECTGDHTCAGTRQLHIYEGPDGLSLWVVMVNNADIEVLEGRTMREGTCTVWQGGSD